MSEDNPGMLKKKTGLVSLVYRELSAKRYWQGLRSQEVWGRRRLYVYLSLHRHHQNVSCIMMGSDESHFNVSLIVRDKVTTVSTDHNF